MPVSSKLPANQPFYNFLKKLVNILNATGDLKDELLSDIEEIFEPTEIDTSSGSDTKSDSGSKDAP